MSSFSVEPLDLEGLQVVRRNHIGDDRGSFARIFCGAELAAFGWTEPVAQMNHSYTARSGTVRGLHFQFPPFAEMKLVTCVRGEVWDIAVDIRTHSPTFLEWRARHLSADNKRAMLIPKGYAHGFQSLTDEVELIYCHSAPWNSASEGILSAIDPRLAITWPLPILAMSTRDSAANFIDSGFTGVAL